MCGEVDVYTEKNEFFLARNPTRQPELGQQSFVKENVVWAFNTRWEYLSPKVEFIA